MKIPEMSVQAGLLIVAIAIIRFVALNRLPKTTFLVMWGIALLRLLVPFSFSSSWSVYSVFGGMMDSIGESLTVPANEVVLNLDGVMRTSEQASKAFDSSGVLVDRTIMLIWLIGVFAVFLTIAFWYFKSHRMLRFAVIAGKSEAIECWLSAHRLRRHLKILQSDRVTSPLSSGILYPRIILPKAMDISDVENVKYVLSHEYFHIRRFDMVWKLLMLLAVCLHWFNPMVWVMVILFNRDLEITCDEMVLRHFGGDIGEKKAYAYSLINMAEAKGGFSPMGSYFSKNSAEERITSIMKYKKTSIFTLAIACVMTIGLAVAFAASPTEEPSGAVDEAITDANISASNAELLDSNGNLIYGYSTTDIDRYTKTDMMGTHFYSESVDCVNGVSNPHVEANARMAIYTNNGGTWNLKADTTVVATFDVAASSNEGEGWSIYFGYEKDGVYEVCQNPRISGGESELSLVVPEDGEYKFFLVNVSAGAIYVDSCEITVN